MAVWDMHVAYIEKRSRWWWNAWREQTATELYGFADTKEAASRAMYLAIEQAQPPPVLLLRRRST